RARHQPGLPRTCRRARGRRRRAARRPRAPRRPRASRRPRTPRRPRASRRCRMTPLVLTLTIAAGAGGALLRYVLQTAGTRARPGRTTRGLTPAWRIVVINVVASFLAGVAFALLPAGWEPVAIAGFCGGLSTWSTFMLDA